MKKKVISTLLALTMIFSFSGTSLNAKAVENTVVSRQGTEEEKGKLYEFDSVEEEIPEQNYGISEAKLDEQNQGLIESKVSEPSKKNIFPLNSFGYERINNKDNIGEVAPSESGVNLDNEVGNVDGKGLPSAIDNSKLDTFPKIYDQVGGSCAASSVYYNYTNMVNLMRGTKAKNNSDSSLDEKHTFIPKYTYNFLNYGSGENGSSELTNWKVIEDGGALTYGESSYCGYDYLKDTREWPTKAETYEDAAKYGISETGSIRFGETSINDLSALDEVKSYLINGYILSFSTYVFSSENNKIISGPHEGEEAVRYQKDTKDGSHELNIVGYDDNVWVDVNGDGEFNYGEKGAFKIANSWGEYYDGSGYFWISYDALRNESNVDGDFKKDRASYGYIKNNSVFFVKPKLTQPKLFAEFTLNARYRSNVNVTLVARNLKNNKNYEFTPYQFQNKGGGYAFDGTLAPCDATLAIDLNRVIEELKPEDIKNYVWELRMDNRNYFNQEDDGIVIKDFRVIDKENNKTYNSRQEEPVQIYAAEDKVIVNPTEEKVIEGARIKTYLNKNGELKECRFPRVIGDRIRLQSEVLGGTESYSYNYKIINNISGDVVINEDTDKDYIEWIPDKEGDYSITLTVTDKKTNEVVNYKRSLLYINGELKIRSPYPQDNRINVNQGVKLYISADGGSGIYTVGVDIKYRGYNWDDSYPIEREDLIVNSRFGGSTTWIPKKGGSYEITPVVTDSNGTEVKGDTFYITVNDSNNRVIAPENLHVEYCYTSNQVELAWDEAKSINDKETTIDKYEIYCDGIRCDTLSGKSNVYTIELDDKEHEYSIRAIDTDKVFSDMTEKVIVPSVAGYNVKVPLKLELKDNNYLTKKLTWNKGIVSNGEVGGYYIYCDGEKIDTVDTNEYIIKNDLVDHEYTVRTFSKAGEVSRDSKKVLVKAGDIADVKINKINDGKTNKFSLNDIIDVDIQTEKVRECHLKCTITLADNDGNDIEVRELNEEELSKPLKVQLTKKGKVYVICDLFCNGKFVDSDYKEITVK